MGQGKDAQHNGALIVTTDRVSFYRKGILGEIIESIPLKNISSIERKSLLGFRKIEVHTSNNSLLFTTTDRATEAAVIEAIEKGRAQQTPLPASPPDARSDGPNLMELLQQLSELRDDGILTDAEFTAKKAEILARI